MATKDLHVYNFSAKFKMNKLNLVDIKSAIPSVKIQRGPAIFYTVPITNKKRNLIGATARIFPSGKVILNVQKGSESDVEDFAHHVESLIQMSQCKSGPLHDYSLTCVQMKTNLDFCIKLEAVVENFNEKRIPNINETIEYVDFEPEIRRTAEIKFKHSDVKMTLHGNEFVQLSGSRVHEIREKFELAIPLLLISRNNTKPIKTARKAQKRRYQIQESENYRYASLDRFSGRLSGREQLNIESYSKFKCKDKDTLDQRKQKRQRNTARAKDFKSSRSYSSYGEFSQLDQRYVPSNPDCQYPPSIQQTNSSYNGSYYSELPQTDQCLNVRFDGSEFPIWAIDAYMIPTTAFQNQFCGMNHSLKRNSTVQKYEHCPVFYNP
ncbi:hypothetical protein ACOME3_006257 [Neoechinorhynchus agilis]